MAVNEDHASSWGSQRSRYHDKKKLGVVDTGEKVTSEKEADTDADI